MNFPILELKSIFMWAMVLFTASFVAAAGPYAFKKMFYRNGRDRRKIDHESIVNVCMNRFNGIENSLNKYTPILEKHEVDIAVLKEQHRNIMASLQRIEEAIKKE